MLARVLRASSLISSLTVSTTPSNYNLTMPSRHKAKTTDADLLPARHSHIGEVHFAQRAPSYSLLSWTFGRGTVVRRFPVLLREFIFFVARV
jgi:hypothetical protein